jgi:hypothetical protein
MVKTEKRLKVNNDEQNTTQKAKDWSTRTPTIDRCIFPKKIDQHVSMYLF